jgi:hypothetical protein
MFGSPIHQFFFDVKVTRFTCIVAVCARGAGVTAGVRGCSVGLGTTALVNALLKAGRPIWLCCIVASREIDDEQGPVWIGDKGATRLLARCGPLRRCVDFWAKPITTKRFRRL